MWETRGLLKQPLTDASVQPQRIFVEEKKKKKTKTTNSTTATNTYTQTQQKHSFPCFPKPDGRWYGTSKTQTQAFVYLALGVIWLCSPLQGNSNLPSKEMMNWSHTLGQALEELCLGVGHRTREDATG